MKIFISWSGDESRQVAEVMHEWIGLVFETVRPYMSAKDNEAGVRWSRVVAAELDETDFGIVCCTRSNLEAPWLLFEAGALSKAVEFARVVPLLHGISTADLTTPLSQFMAKEDDRAGVLELVQAINRGLDAPRSDAVLAAVFDQWWPHLNEKLRAIAPPAPSSAPPVPTRTERDLLEEILKLVRAQASPAERPLSSLIPTSRDHIAHLARRDRLDEPLLIQRLRQDALDRLRDELVRLTDDGVGVHLDSRGGPLVVLIDREVPDEPRAEAVALVEATARVLGVQVRLVQEPPGAGRDG